MSIVDEERLDGYVPCDICGEPANKIQGGEYLGVHQLWLVCEKCDNKIRDWRKEHRKN